MGPYLVTREMVLVQREIWETRYEVRVYGN